MRDVAVIGFAQSIDACDRTHNEVELVSPVVAEAVRQSGIAQGDIGFTVSGSCDYLSGGPFTFVQGLDAVGAWPPIKESHVEMDAAWALYEAWVAIQVGDVDSALVYGFGKSSTADIHEVFSLQNDPYYVAPLWPSTVDLAALQASAALAAGAITEREIVAFSSECHRSAQSNSYAITAADISVDDALTAAVTHPPLRDADIAPITDGAVAVVLAADDAARNARDRPAWIRGIEHRIEPQSLGVRDLSASASTRAAADAAAVSDGAVDVAEIHAQFGHEGPLLVEALGLGVATVVNPSGGPLGANPIMSAGLIRIGEVAARIWSGDVSRGIAHATQGPCLQQNLVCVLAGEGS